MTSLSFSRPYRAVLRSAAAQTPLAALRRAPAQPGDFFSTRRLREWRTHTPPVEPIATGPGEVIRRAPGADLHARSRSPSSIAPVTSEVPDTDPTATAVDGSGEPTCLVKSGHRLARGTFYPEADAARLALGPRLPHHRHALTADELLAGIVLAAVCLAAAIYVLARLI